MAKSVSCNSGTIFYWLKKHGIPIRRHGTKEFHDYQSKRVSNVMTPEHRKILSKAQKRRFSSEEERWKQSERIKRTMTPERRRQISEANQGRDPSWIDRWRASITDEEIERRRARKVAYWQNPENVAAHSEFMKEFWSDGANKRAAAEWNEVYWTEERRQEHSRIMSEIGQDEERNKKVSDAVKAAWSRGVYDNNSWEPTSIEIATRLALEELSVKYIEQYRPKGYSRVYDFFLPDLHTIIEVHGCYWHDYRNFPRQDQVDGEKEVWARRNGYDYVVLWEDEIDQYSAVRLLQDRLSLHIPAGSYKYGVVSMCVF